MDRDDGTDKTRPSAESGAAQTNTRLTSSLVINSASRRRSLFARPGAKEDAARPPSSSTVPHAQTASPSNTRIPRLSEAHSRQFSVPKAYRIAEEEEAAQGSPSPAPRAWRARRDSVGKRNSQIRSPATTEPQPRGCTDGRSAIPARGSSLGDRLPLSQQSDVSDSTFDKKLHRYALGQPDSEESEEADRRDHSLLPRSKFGTKLVEAGRGLTRKTDRGSPRGGEPGGTPSSQLPRATASYPSPSRRIAAARRESIAEQRLPSGISPRGAFDVVSPEPQTPSKSFAWQADADFTAGDLQVSNSPPVAIRRSNTKIDQIRALEAEVNDRFSASPQHRPFTIMSDNPASPESEAGAKRRNEQLNLAPAVKDSPKTGPEVESKPTHTQPGIRASRAANDFRPDEVAGLIDKGLTTASPVGSHEHRNAVPRSPSPDPAPGARRDPVRGYSPLGSRWRRECERELAATKSVPEGPARPGTLGQALRTTDYSAPKTMDAENTRSASEAQLSHRVSPQTKEESRDLLRRLAVATSSSSPPGVQAIRDSRASAATNDQDVAENARQKRLASGAKGDARPTVGFVGLQRTSSVESRLAKRSSFVHSDSDPTERIEGEMKLFAPLENQSERSSLRAPSPEPEEELADETPRPIKTDPLTQPTPRVTGAYVETPATVKVERIDDLVSSADLENSGVDQRANGSGLPRTDDTIGPKTSLPRGEKDGAVARQQKRPQSAGADRGSSRSSSVSSRRRARSFSRGRRPLVNSARPPTVRDDILEIQRANQIDDSTLEDLADLLGQQDFPGVVSSSQTTRSGGSNNDRIKIDKETELAVYDRMNDRLKTGLIEIRSAKQGIQRLEDKVAHAASKEHAANASRDGKAGEEEKTPPCPICPPSPEKTKGTITGQAAAVTYIHLPLPRLWHHEPTFRLTLAGLALLLLSLWYAAESAMCARYCKPAYCYPGSACDWSPDDPAWGSAIPVKVDQWVTGGQGRELARRLRPELADWFADLSDALTGTDIASVDVSRYSWEQKRQHRRRLAKKGLSKKFVERPEDRDVFRERKAVREAQERAEMGYGVGEDESMARDERL